MSQGTKNYGEKEMKLSRIRDVKFPTRGTAGSAGIDFYVPNDYPLELCTVAPGDKFFIPSGIRANVPNGHALIAFNKSGVALKKGLAVGAAVVDSDYQGEIHLHLFNTTTAPVEISRGEKILQFLLVPINHCDIEEEDDNHLFSTKSSRGSGGFGSTGVS